MLDTLALPTVPRNFAIDRLADDKWRSIEMLVWFLRSFSVLVPAQEFSGRVEDEE